MQHFKDFNCIGIKFGLLTVIDVVKGFQLNDKKIPKKVICLCECGARVAREWRCFLKNKNTSSCGCLLKKKSSERMKNKKTHGHTTNKKQSAEYNIWHCMKTRCLNPKAKNYHRYGRRGIKICDRWLDLKNGFINFLSDMGKRPNHKLSVDRINNNGNYEPNNCRWATAQEQVDNSSIKKQTQAACLICHKEIFLIPSNLYTKKYCSLECRNKGLHLGLWRKTNATH